MTPRALMQALADRGVSIAVEGDRLRVQAPAGALTPDLRAAIGEHRAELIRLLRLADATGPLPTPPDPASPYALSPPQQRLWYMDQLAGAQAAYVIPAAVYLHGALDVHALESAVRQVAARHDSLRTAFTASQGEPRQQVRPIVQVDLTVSSLEHLPARSRRDEAERRTSALAAEPFDLSAPPLFRTGLFRLSADEHLWFLCIHHLIADGSSLRLLLDEVIDTYGAIAGGSHVPRAPDAVQYGTFVAWQQARLESGAMAPMLDAWRRTLEGTAPLDLPTDRPRTAERRFDGGAEIVAIPRDVTEALRLLARDRAASLFAVLLAAWQVLMARMAGQRDVAIGTAMANRGRPEFEPVVGCLANTVVIRSDIDADQPFVDLVTAVHARIRDAWAGQELPFERIVEALKHREAGRNPVFDVFFALNVPIAGTRRAGLQIEPVFVRPRAAKFELALFCEDTADGLRGLLEYQSDLFDSATARRIAARFAALAAGIAHAPDTPVGRLPVLPAEERAIIEAGWRAACRPFRAGATVPDLVAEQAERTPAAVAAQDAEGTITYGELVARATHLGRRLRSQGLGPGRLVGLAIERSIDMVVGVLGVLESGAAYLPLDAAFPADRLRLIAEDSGLDTLLTTDRRRGADGRVCVAIPTPSGARRLRLEDLEAPDLAADPPDAAAPRATPDDLAYVLYTSGSTGRPKGVEVTHRNVVNFLESMAREPGLAPTDVLLAVTTLSFDIAVLELLLPLVVGARTVIATREEALDGASLAAAIDRAGATIVQATPSTWRMLIEAGFRPARPLRILSGGEPLSARLAQRLCAIGAEVWNLYGPTETTVWSSVSRVSPGEAPTLGHPVANTSIYVLDGHGQPAPIGVTGEICIGGEGVARGYRGRPDLTAERFTPDPRAGQGGVRMYRTGDRGAVGGDGRLHFRGRSDDQLKIRGFRVEPAEIEAALARHQGVQQAVVVGRRLADDDVRLVGFVRCAADAYSPESFRRFLGDRLPSYMIPSAFTRVDEWPMTPNGKVDRVALAARVVDVAPPPRTTEMTPPRSEVEACLAEIWRQVLGVEAVGVRDSFFELGGHSLLAARVVSRAEAALGVRLPIAIFATQPTIEEHARFIEEERAGPEARMEKLLEWVENLTEEEARRYLGSR